MTAYKFATDSMHGTLNAENWDDAMEQLAAMLREDVRDEVAAGLGEDKWVDGGWGWVEDEDGLRHSINC